jgi:hypothetical protein
MSELLNHMLMGMYPKIHPAGTKKASKNLKNGERQEIEQKLLRLTWKAPQPNDENQTST